MNLFFNVDHFFLVFIEFVTILLLFYVFWFFWPRGMWDLSFLASNQAGPDRPGIEPAPPALEGEVLTTGPRGKSLNLLLLVFSVT